MRSNINKTPISSKKILRIIGLIIIAGFIVVVSNFTPEQTIEVGEYKNYQIK
jgi:hypothetical protein